MTKELSEMTPKEKVKEGLKHAGMTPDEAIEILEQDLSADHYNSPPHLYRAEKLGIEALKVVKKWREQHRDLGFLLMPGEKEE